MILARDPPGEFRASVDALLNRHDTDRDRIGARRFPDLEFNAKVNGKPARLRLTHRPLPRNNPNSALQTDTATGSQHADNQSGYRADLSTAGTYPREMRLRRYLLRLHMAHGYPVEKNTRWFWVIAVDVMFVSMCFRGLSGVVMWWQIKRTRRIGFLLLLASAAVAPGLAIGMHAHLMHG